jgi:hypothetical protein
LILAIDLGSRQSAWVLFETRTGRILDSAFAANAQVAESARELRAPQAARWARGRDRAQFLRESGGRGAFRDGVSRGIFVGGWRAHRPGESVVLVPRLDIRVHLGVNGGDSEVRAALIRRLGEQTTRGISTHRWAALVIAVVAADRLRCGMRGKETELYA